ncbi:regucalcin-like [Anticarsia gemmatalis]|uniref:regucalcin-like n=1 Tax=Anticarsia gemmatalis TaxID=129554 RepID=UPI003F7580B8
MFPFSRLSVYHIIMCFFIPFMPTIFVQNVKEEKKSTHYKIFEYTNLTFDHAESPVWDSDTNTLLWVDVLNQDIHSLNYYTKKHRIKHIAYGEVNIIVPIKDSDRLLVAVKSELFLLDWNKTGNAALRLLARFDECLPGNILNEGKADVMGRFWGGTKGRQQKDKVEVNEGSLYSLEAPYFVAKVHVRPVTISNGLVWSLNNTVMYYTDSHTRKIDAFDFDAVKGQLSNRRTIINLCKEGWRKEVIPDGMTIDKDGFLWIALMFDGCVIRVDPDRRRVVEVHRLPVSRTTSMTWAGPDLDVLVVTTSRRNMDEASIREQPLSGALFMLHNLGTRGVPDHKFVFPNVTNY